MHTHGIHYHIYGAIEAPVFFHGTGHLWLPGCTCDGNLNLGHTLTAECIAAGTDWYHK